MTPRDWRLFLESGQEKPIKIAQVHDDLAAYLGAVSNIVHLAHAYAIKAVEKHGLDISYFDLIFETVDFGTAVHDRPNHLTFYYEDRLDGRGWHQVTVKCAPGDKKLYLSTFYKQRSKEVARRIKRGKVVRK